jgi:hypothetical protein
MLDTAISGLILLVAGSVKVFLEHNGTLIGSVEFILLLVIVVVVFAILVMDY